MVVKKEILFRAGLVYVGFLLFGIAIIARILFIQMVEGDKLRKKTKELTLKNFTIDPARGDILATDGRLLATSIPSYEIRMDMRARGLTDEAFKDNIDSLSLCLSKLFKDKTKSTYRNNLLKAYRDGDQYYLIKRKVDYVTLKKLKQFPLFRLGRNKSGLVEEQENVRFLPNYSLASRTIGYISKGTSYVGIEGSFNEYLKGTQGIRFMQRLSGGAWMPVYDNNEVDPKDGYDITTTIDINLQDVAESALRKQLGKSNAHHGCAILMEVETGEIKAIANLGKDKSGAYTEILNYAISECTEPGSTFKLASMIAAFEDGYIQMDDTVDTRHGSIKYHGEELKDSHEKGYGKISVKRAFELSSNVGISYLINKYYEKKPRQFVDRLYAMKLNNSLNLDIKGEGKPEIKYPGDKTWSGISLPWMSIGYETRLAPIHTLTFYNAIANNGKMIKPHFVKEITYHGKKIKEFGTDVIESSICSNATLKKVREMLEGVVDSGTAKNLKNKNYKIAGKTGTAQIAKLKNGYKKDGVTAYQASFVGYFPADNPKYTCIVVINSPSNSVYYGNLVAGPVFKEIADKVYATSLNMQPALKVGSQMADIPFTKTGLKPELDYILNKLDIEVVDNNIKSDWVSTKKEDLKIKYNNRTIIKNLVPNVVDMGLRDAMFLLENAGLRVIVRGSGKVVHQSITPGVRVKHGDYIVLDMSLS
jgi:cell division protein FtsI (penicillin-binding protein 3)